QDGELIDNNNTTLGDYSSTWLKNKKTKDNLSPTTIDGYANIINNHIIPTIGDLKLQEIKAYNLQKYFDIKINKLSPRTLLNHKRVLVAIFISALDMELIEKNPLLKVKLQRDKREETKVLTIEESKLLLDVVQNHFNLKMPVTLALLLGLRRGECLGLTWDNIDYVNKTITINQNLEVVKGELYLKAPKTAKSKRTIAMPESLIPILKKHYKWQREMVLRSGSAWKNEYNLICTRKRDGKPFLPNNISDAFRNFLLKKNLPVIRFHDLRHTNATLMLAAGVSAKVAGNRLGHSSISITLDLYSHVLQTVDQEVAEKLDNILGK
ncbi:MAG: site-specific integrase, partial [Clostridium sp.]